MRTKYDFDSIEKMKNPQFKVVLDDMGTEYIVWDDSPIETDIGPMGDRTAFEAVENHIHLVDGINRSEFDALCILGKELADLCLSRLKQHHPDRMFLVYVSIRLGDSMILRFHQEWDGEAHYYEKKIHTYNERLIKCRG